MELYRSEKISGLALTLERCSNQTSPVVCKSEDEIDKWAKEHSISLHARRSYVAYEETKPYEGPLKFITEEVETLSNYDFIQSKNIWIGFDEH